MQVYRSKVSWIIYIPIFISLIPLTAIIIVDGFWLAALAIVPVVLFILYIFLRTEYIVTDGTLKISCGFLYNQQINIGAITIIRETNSPISSPALSLDRIEIRYNKYDNVLISPKNKQEFIEHLQLINPAIEFIGKQ